MTGLDCNILVQLALQDHPANAATITAVQAEVKRGSRPRMPSAINSPELQMIRLTSESA